MADASPWSRTYITWSIACWLGFLGAVLLLGRAAGSLPDHIVWAVVLAVTAAVAAQFVAAYRLVAAQDEYVRGLTAKRVIAAAGLTLTLAVFWGLAQQFIAVPHVPLWALYPLFWGAFGLVTPLIRTSRP